MIEKDIILKIIDEIETKHSEAMNNAKLDDMITYYGNQGAVLVLEDLKHKLKHLVNGEA